MWSLIPMYSVRKMKVLLLNAAPNVTFLKKNSMINCNDLLNNNIKEWHFKHHLFILTLITAIFMWPICWVVFYFQGYMIRDEHVFNSYSHHNTFFFKFLSISFFKFFQFSFLLPHRYQSRRVKAGWWTLLGCVKYAIVLSCPPTMADEPRYCCYILRRVGSWGDKRKKRGQTYVMCRVHITESHPKKKP